MRNVKLEPGAVKCQMKTDKCRLDILMCSVFYNCWEMEHVVARDVYFSNFVAAITYMSK